MSQVQLQVRPRRVRCTDACESPPFRFSASGIASSSVRRAQRGAIQRALLFPFQVIWFSLRALGRLIDAAFFLVVLAVWNAMHLVVWSYAFEIGPAANCFGLPCPPWLASKVVIACVVLAVLSYVLARSFRRLGHRATSAVLLLLVTLDVAALMILGVGALTG